MGSKKTKYTKAFKAEAVKLVKEQGYSVTAPRTTSFK